MLKNTHNSKKVLIINVLCLVLFLLVHVYLINMHEAWRDEAQAWVLVKNSSLFELFSLLSSEGHPSLWFLAIYPFVKLGLDFRFFSYVSLGFVTIALFLFLSFGEFPYWIKVAVMCSSLFTYFNPVISRIYSLLILLVVMIGLIWRKRRSHMILYGIIIALLFQSHILMCGLAIGCVVDIVLIICKKEHVAHRFFALFISLVSFLLMILELWQRTSGPVAQQVNVNSVFSQFSVSNIINGILSFAQYCGYIWLGCIVLLLFGCYLCYSIYIVKKGKELPDYLHEILVVLFACAGYFGVVCLVRAALHIQMALCFNMIMFVSCWILYTNSNQSIKKKSLCMLLIFTFISYLSVFSGIKEDVLEDFSKSKEMAYYICDTMDGNDIVIVENQPTTPTVYAYVSSQYDEPMFADISTGKQYTYMQWGRTYIIEHDESEIRNFANKMRKGTTDKVYYLSSRVINEEVSFSLIKACDDKNVWEECYYLYLVD